MKNFRLLSVVTLLLVLVLMTFGLNASSSPAVSAQNEAEQKVIATKGLLDTEHEGVSLWHDYGAFALYRVSEAASEQLTADQTQLVDDRLLIDAYTFNTQTEALIIPKHMQLNEARDAALHLVQFVGPIKDEWLKALEDVGVTPIHYIANNGYLVWADANGRSQLNTLVEHGDFLQYNTPYHPYFKLGTNIHNRIAKTSEANGVVPVTAQIYDHANKGVTEQLIKDVAVEQLSDWYPILNYQNIGITLRVSDIATIAQRPDVVWIGEQFEFKLSDERQGQIMTNAVTGGQLAQPGYLDWLNSLGFSTDPNDYPIVDIVDGGIGNGNINSGDRTFHKFGNASLPSRLVYVSNCTSSANGAGEDGHGHIIASIVGGYDTLNEPAHRDSGDYQLGLGINPYGRFAGTRIYDGDIGPDLSKCDGSFIRVIKNSQDNGARITNNSWCETCSDGNNTPLYDATSQIFDVGVRDADQTQMNNQEMIMIFSAGNFGSNNGTVGSPANAKNVITVGASEMVRPSEDGNRVSCNIGPLAADDWRDVAFFSSRGPAPGNRIKPEVIAPGVHIQGTSTTASNFIANIICERYYPPDQTIFAASSGTSYSAAAVAGTTSLYYYWLQTEYNITPSPAMMKSYLIAHPTYLTGDDANDTLPSNNQGYGMPNLQLAFDDSERLLVDQSVVFNNTGETWNWNGQVADPSRPVRIVMAYTDQASANGTGSIVNNIDLAATVAGTAYVGNQFSGEWSTAGGMADGDNNYEAIFLPAGTNGNIEITLTALNIGGDGIPNNSDITDQDFALVCYNCTASTSVGGDYIWQPNATGTLFTDYAWDYAMGYHFTPQVDGFVTELGGFFDGTKQVKLFNAATGSLLAEATVTDNYNWDYTVITPVPVYAGVRYTVAAYLAGSGASRLTGASIPQTYNNVRIDGTTYASTSVNPNAIPTNSYATVMVGQADIRFLPTQTGWSGNESGTLQLNQPWDYALGYHFTPQTDGFVTDLGGFFNGTKQVKLFERSSGTLLAQATVTAANDWRYTAITPVPVQADLEYTVAAYLAGSGASYRNSLPVNFPQTYGDIRIDSTTYADTSSDPNAIPNGFVRIDAMYGQADIRFLPSQTPPPANGGVWSDNENGTLRIGLPWDYALGYHFTPQTNGLVTDLGGFFDGTKQVKLFERSSGTLLAQATVTAANDWNYTAITPIPVQAGVEYTVAAYLAGSGASYRYLLTANFPQTYGDIQIHGSAYANTSTNPNAIPNETIINTMYGQADIIFAPLSGTTTIMPQRPLAPVPE